jgi:hypothetical protein
MPVQPPIDHITIRDNFTFTFTHKLNLKEPLPSDWLALTSSDWIASIGKVSDSGAFLIMFDQFLEVIQRVE